MRSRELFLVAAMHGLSIPGALAQGADACREGFVWREAFSGDHVCVTPQTRTQAARDNSAAAARRQPGGGAYGAETCRQGYVWRDAGPNDHVCVTPATRAQASADNQAAATRIARPTRIAIGEKLHVTPPRPQPEVIPTPEPKKPEPPAATDSKPVATAKPQPRPAPRPEVKKSEPAKSEPAQEVSFWSTLPGMLTALAAVLSALAGLVAAFRKG